MTDDFNCTVLPNGQLRLMLDRDGAARTLDINSEESSIVVAKILVAAQAAFRKSGKTMPDFTKTESSWLVVYPASIGLAPARQADHECLIVRFGDARIGLEFPSSQLQSLGMALVLSASQDFRQ